MFMEFTQDYSTFVDKEFSAVWMKALSAGAMAQPALLQLDKFYFETEAPAQRNGLPAVEPLSLPGVLRCSGKQYVLCWPRR